MKYEKNKKYPTIVGRVNEIAELEKFYDHKKSGLLVVYGRRRIGKTYLIKEFFKRKEKENMDFFFKVTGVDPENSDFLKSKNSQMQNFFRYDRKSF